jgi:ribosomal protein L31E
MKGEQAEYVISLVNVFRHPPLKRIKRALNEIKRFVKKHSRIEEVAIDQEVNEFLHKNSKNIPRKLNATLVKDGEKIIVYLTGSKKIEEDQKKGDAEKKEKKKGAKEEKKKEGKEKKEETGKEKSNEEKEEEQKKKLEEKKKLEKAAAALEHKRK